MSKQMETRCIHGNSDFGYQESTRAVSFPIYQTATFGHIGLGQSSGYDYTRQQNHTRQRLEEVMSALESACDTVAFSSGMSAVSVCFELLRPGDHIICSEDLYGGVTRLFQVISQKNGLSVSYADTTDLEKVRKLLRPETRALYIETPSNPMMNVTDLRACAALAKEHGLLLIVDNTFLSPYLQNPIELGADLVLHSGTKFLGGHNDTICGFLSSATPELAERIRQIAVTTGGVLAPFDGWLILRGLKTLAVRMEKQQENAEKVARWLTEQPRVTRVFYAGLPEHPGYEINKSQARGAGSMISFRTDSVRVVSDEIHCDFTYEGHPHHCFLEAVPELSDRTVVCTAPSKTFNLAGLQISNIWIPDAEIRRRFVREIDRSGYSQLNGLGLVACEAAYAHGAEWLDQCRAYLRENLDFLRDFLTARIPEIRLVEPEGTYFAWLDCSGLGLDRKALNDLVIHRAKLWLDAGHIFGEAAGQFQRIVLACPRATLRQALEQLGQAVRA